MVSPSICPNAWRSPGEMAFLKGIGNLLDKSGQADILQQVKVAALLSFEFFVALANLCEARYAHYLTCFALYSLLKKADDGYKDGKQSADTFDTFVAWYDIQTEKYLVFQFRSLIFRLQIMLLTFLSSLGDCHLYGQSLKSMVPIPMSFFHEQVQLRLVGIHSHQ